MVDERQWYAGIDWASESHHALLTVGDGRKIGERVFEHGGEGLAEMAAWLMAVVLRGMTRAELAARRTERCHTVPAISRSKPRVVISPLTFLVMPNL